MWATLRSILFSAVLSGLLGGAALTGLQAFKVLPLIWQAETYEAATGETPPTAAHPPAPGIGHDAIDVERLATTLLANVLVGVGFALLLCAAYTVKGNVDWRRGLAWGLMGYAAFTLAPAFGLPPELPGMRGGDLAGRQVWWFATMAATAAGLALLCLGSKAALRLIGAVVVTLPHLIGPPHPAISDVGRVPAELAAAFVSATLVVNLLFWLLLGGLSAAALNKLSPHAR